MIKHLGIMAVALLSVSSSVFGYSMRDLDRFKNDKEVKITVFGKGEAKRILGKYFHESEQTELVERFKKSLLRFVNNEHLVCEMKLVDIFHNELDKSSFENDQKSMEEHFKLLRSIHEIDDIFYELLVGINKDYFALKELKTTRRAQGLGLNHQKLFDKNDIPKMFNGFKQWPDESDDCVYAVYNDLKKQVRTAKDEVPKGTNELHLLTLKALKDDLITLDTYHRLEYLRNKSFINKRNNLWLADYIDIIFKAKNRMVPETYVYQTKNIYEEHKFSSEKIKLFSKMTRRKLLYTKYTPTQIIMLSQLLKKAAERMGADPDTISSTVVLTQKFTKKKKKNENLSEQEAGIDNYVEARPEDVRIETLELDPQSQYNLARRRMRKDMLDLQVMDEFLKVQITFDDVVMAGLETGYVSLEDIALIVKFDDLWNPEVLPVQKVLNFVFRVSGYASFYIPAPWNIVAMIALGVTEGLVDNLFKSGATNDNPATFIE